MATLIFAMVLGKMEVGRAACAAPMKYGAKVRVWATLPLIRPWVSCLLQQIMPPHSFFSAENQRSFDVKTFLSGS
jgi:hypothetical protein